jgi:hypothetical protein
MEIEEMSVESSIRHRRRKNALSAKSVVQAPQDSIQHDLAAAHLRAAHVALGRGRSSGVPLANGKPLAFAPSPRNWDRPELSDSPPTATTPKILDLAVAAQAEPDPGCARRFQLFRDFGNFTMAYATLQPGMEYFESNGGYLAFNKCWGIPFVLSDPVAPAENHAAIIEAFVRRNPRACFCQISAPTGAILDRLGWFVNEFGADMELDLPTYDFSGPKKSKLRQAANKIEREGYTIEERDAPDGDRSELEALCAAWLAKKTVKREARFLVRPVAFGNEPGVRNFYLRDRSGWVVSFVAFDPICEKGEVIGYSPAIKRHSAEAPTG